MGETKNKPTVKNRVNTWVNFVEIEHKILDFWNKNQSFEKLQEKQKDKEPWSFLDGPITANNPMGVHHAWGRTLKDTFQRYWAMNDRKLRYQNGFDCQGLWVEVEVEKELGFKTKKDIEAYGIDKFVNQCKERVNKFSDIQTKQSIRLGYWMDWDHSYYTMSDTNNYAIWAFLKKCYDKGLIYKGVDIMPWCARCGTGISQHEMHEGYLQVTHPTVFLLFPIAGREKEALMVWTTTPWTLTSNVAAAVHPELKYAKVQQGDWVYYLVESKVEEVIKKKGKYKILETFPGKELTKLSYLGPFDELTAQKETKKPHPVIEWDEVSDTEGTGIVHIAPGCGKEDYELGKQYDLDLVAPINEEGLFTKEFDWLAGTSAMAAGQPIFDNLKQKGILYHLEDYTHSYPHCWRCKTELLFRYVDEWFIQMDPWREDIMEIVKQIKWIPPFGKDLELDWLRNMHDWMISKKRYWGLALPIYECDECGHFEVIGSKQELQERAVEGWKDFEGHSPHRPWVDQVKIKCSKCDQIVSRIKDVGNPWLDAGIVTYSTVHYFDDKEYWKTWIPADLVLECFPGQFRNWFYSLLAMSTMMENVRPFKTLLGHALVRDEKGEEMHKSKGNAIWFDDAVEEIGADVMRWIYCRQETSTNLNFGYSIAKEYRGKFFNTLWNSYAFFYNYAVLADWKPPKSFVPVNDRPEFDRWILSNLQLLIKDTRKAYEDCLVRGAVLSIEKFVDNLSNWYIRNNRRRFWKVGDEKDSEMAFQTLYQVLTSLIKIMAPIIPFVTEEIYQNLVKGYDKTAPESIHHTLFPEVDEKLLDKDLSQWMDAIIDLNSLGLSARKSAGIKVRQPLSNLTIGPANETASKAANLFKDMLLEEINIKKITILEPDSPIPIQYNLKPNFATLGKKLGSLLKPFGEYLKKNEKEILDHVLHKRNFEVKLDGRYIEMEPVDILVEEQKPENLSVATDGRNWVAIDLNITEDLKREGIMRDLLRKLQALRKDRDLAIEDRVIFGWDSSSPVFKQIFEEWGDYIDKELLCVERKDQEVFDPVHEIKIDQETIKVSLKVV